MRAPWIGRADQALLAERSRLPLARNRALSARAQRQIFCALYIPIPMHGAKANLAAISTAQVRHPWAHQIDTLIIRSLAKNP
jgi:hypothetical protein